MAWTKMQQAAIDQRKTNILVSAAAGSGKTAVLTERVMKRIIGNETEQPIEMDRFLIVTFTSAAAQEMKERISNKLSEQMNELQMNGELDNPIHLEKINYLERQLALVHKASISTIHSFCLKIIKSYFNKLDIDPNIKVGNEAELNVMKEEILEELIEERFEEEDSKFLDLAEVYGSVQGMSSLMELVLDVYTFSKSTPFPEVWLQNQVNAFTTPYIGLSQMPWAGAIKSYVIGQITDLISIYKEALRLCDLSNGPILYRSVIEEDQRYIKDLDNTSSLEEMIQGINQTKFGMLPRKKQECDEGIKEQVKAYRDLGKDVIKNLQGDLAFLEDSRLIEQLPKIGHLMSALIELIQDFEVRYAEAKQSAGVVDYSDLEHLCMKLLVEPIFDEEGILQEVMYTDVAKELSQFYEEVYIDEYQDSNIVQETILKAVAEGDSEKGATRFMVGDMKQSIYRFRLANPLIFAEKYQNWDKHSVEQEVSAKDICIDLSQNFRSRENILQGVNDIFEQVMSTAVGELEYDDYAKLKVGNSYTEGNLDDLQEGSLSDSIEFHILETKEQQLSEENETGLEDLKSVECEALMVAQLIDQLLKGEGNPTHVFDKELGTYRCIEARDIVILLRATKGKANLFENALLSKGIGSYAEVSNNFFEALEIQTIISLLKIIDNPLQDIPLITVLRSPIIGLTLDDLVHIRKTQEEGCFYEALKSYSEIGEKGERIQQFIEQLQTYRTKSNELTVVELIAMLYVETGYYRYVEMLPTGAKKKANLALLKKYAETFESSNNSKLFGFIKYLEKLEETSEGLQEAKLVGENENLVRIMSIHKSKGLEFSVVFLCDTAKRFNNNDLMKSVLLHSDLGLGPDFIDAENYVRYPSIPKIAIKNQIVSENISEEMRILYVALTRAKEKLFITGNVSNLRKRVQEWSLFALRKEKSILPLGVKKGASYLNWIGMSLFAHSEIKDVRELLGKQVDYVFKGQAKWKLKVWSKEDLGTIEMKQQNDLQAQESLIENWDTETVYGDYKEEIQRRLDFQYPYEQAALLPTKVSVSEIKRQIQRSNEGDYIKTHVLTEESQNEIPIPSFIKDRKVLQGARRGTLIHSVLEHLDFLKFTEVEEIKEEIMSLIAQNKIEAEVLEVIDYQRLVKMACSDMAKRMKNAKKVWKEKSFVYLAKANQIDSSYPEDEEILVQGIVDTFFLEEDEIVLIDYKTDYVDLKNKKESISKIKERYKTQLEIYEEALVRITGIPVKQKVIYLYTVDEWVTL